METHWRDTQTDPNLKQTERNRRTYRAAFFYLTILIKLEHLSVSPRCVCALSLEVAMLFIHFGISDIIFEGSISPKVISIFFFVVGTTTFESSDPLGSTTVSVVYRLIQGYSRRLLGPVRRGVGRFSFSDLFWDLSIGVRQRKNIEARLFDLWLRRWNVVIIPSGFIHVFISTNLCTSFSFERGSFREE